MKSLSVSRLSLALLLMMQATACISVTNTLTADTLGEGNTQFAVAPSYVIATGEAGESGALGGVQAQVLHGTSDTMDVGGRLSYQRFLGSGDSVDDFSFNGFGAEFLSRIQLSRSEKLNLAVAPSLGFSRVAFSGEGGGDGINAIQAKVPLLIGVPVGEHQFVGSLALSDAFFFGEGDSSNTINAGATVGFAARVPGTGVRIMPEVGVFYPVVGGDFNDGAEFNDSGTFYLQFAVGVMFGGGDGDRDDEEEAIRESLLESGDDDE